MLFALLLESLPTAALAQKLPPPALNPRRYASASGELTLLVDPSDRRGRGAAKYRLEKSGKDLWSGEKPYTLYEAVVANDGTAAGYAYTHGIEGFAKEGGRRAGNGTFELVILDPTGRERLDESIERKDSRFLHADPTPEAAGLLIVAASWTARGRSCAGSIGAPMGDGSSIRTRRAWLPTDPSRSPSILDSIGATLEATRPGRSRRFLQRETRCGQIRCPPASP
jgi:hypothetical protein